MKHNSIIFFTDNTAVNESLINMLQVNYKLVICSYSSDSWEDIDFYSKKNIAFILDTMPAEKDAFWIVSKLYEDGVFMETPVLFTDFETMYNFERQGFSSFAYDVLPNPFNYDVAVRRIENITEIRQLKIQFTNLTQIHTKRILNQANKLKEQTSKMQTMNFELVELLVAAIESRDMESGQHIKRIRYFTKALTSAVMEMCPEYGIDSEKAEYIYYASSVHDIGKIAIPDAVMLKPGRLTADEFDIMKTHTTRGAELLGMLDGISSTNLYFKYCQEICLYHHERWDGCGYPYGLIGDDTPISAQIVAVADCYDALTSHRPYKKALSHEEAVELILSGACGAFSPNIIKCFSSVIPEFAKIENELKNVEPEKSNSQPINQVLQTPEYITHTVDPVVFENKILSAYDIVFTSDILNGNFDVISGSWDEFFPYVPKNFKEFISHCYRLCHPADAARFLSKVNLDAFNELAKMGREKTRVEFRVIKDGVEYLAAGFIVFNVDENKNIISLDGAFNVYHDDEILTDIKRGFGVTDGLTGLLLPNNFENDVESFISRNPDSNCLMIFIDIDDMSLCNSIFGYEYGNTLIKEFAAKLRDINSYNKIICKEASDKFALFVTDFAKYADMALFVENLHNLLRKPYHTATESGEFTVTLGISRYPQDGNTCRHLVAAAEYASENCKVNGKSSFAFYNNGMIHLASITDDVKTNTSAQSDYIPKFVPIVNAITNELVCYDYIPFSEVDDSIAVTTEVYYELNKDAASRKNLSSLSIKSLLYMMLGIKKQGNTPPPVSVYTMFMPDDMTAFLQELEQFVSENDCSGIDLCIILPQDFLEAVSLRRLKSIASIINKLGFKLGLYLIGTRYIHNKCYCEDIFSRYIVTSDFVEHTISTGATEKNLTYAGMTLNNLRHYVDNVTIPFELSEFEKTTMINGGATDFSCTEKAVFGLDQLLSDFDNRKVSDEVERRDSDFIREIEPVLLYHDITKTSCVLFTYYIAEKRLAASSNIKDVFGEDVFDNIAEAKTSFDSIHPDDSEVVRNAMAKARTSLEPVTFVARVIKDGMYQKFVFTIFFIVDENGTPLRIQCSISSLFE